MSRSFVSRALRALALFSLVATAAACGGSGDSDGDRQRNEALPTAVDFEVSWVPEGRSFELSAAVDKVVVDLVDGSGTVLKSFQSAGRASITSITVPEDIASDLEASASVRITAMFLNPDDSTADETTLEFDAKVGAVKAASLMPPEGYFGEGDGGSSSDTTTTTVEENTDWVVGFPTGQVDISQFVTLPEDISIVDSVVVTARVKGNQFSPEATFLIEAEFWSRDQQESFGNGAIGSSVFDPATGFTDVTYTIEMRPLLESFPGTGSMRIKFVSDAKSSEPGFRGVVMTSASAKVGERELLTNTDFNDGNASWTSSVTEWDDCVTGTGQSPCVAQGWEPTDPSMITNTTTTTEVPAEETTTTEAENNDAPGDPRQTISIQEQECSADYTASTRTVTLCRSFDRIVAAGFEADGGFADTVKGDGQTLVLPENFVGDNKVTLLRLAVATKVEGLEFATFRGEGVIQIGAGDTDLEGHIMVSPEGSEAMNNAGEIREMEVEITGAGKFDIDWPGDFYDETKFAFVTLNGVAYDYYENVTPPDTWDDGEPLLWRAYSMDGFGLPRLVANGAIAYGDDQYADFYDPFFELWGQSVTVIQSETGEEIIDEDECAGNLPYLITEPITPSSTSRVTLTVDRDCDDENGALGLQVWAEDNFDSEWDYQPLFSRMVATRYNSRIEETIVLASGEYVIIWGNEMSPTGTHNYRVTAPGSEVSCIYPSVEVDTSSLTGRLDNCVTGNRRVSVWAEPLGEYEGDEVRVPLRNGVLDFSGLPFTGPLDVEIDIDDAPDGDMVVCWESCGSMTEPEEGEVTGTFDTSGFSASGQVVSDLACGEIETNDTGVDYFHRTSPTSWSWVQWHWEGASSLPFAGEYFAELECWDQESNEWREGTTSFTVDGPMPNRPANDNFEDASEITTEIGRVEFSTVSATSQAGEMGPYSSGVRADQFRSVWFKRTIAEGEDSISFALDKPDFWSVVRIFRLTPAGKLGLVDEWWWSAQDEDFYGEEDGFDFGRRVESDATPGAVFYVQVLGDWVYDAGRATLVVNGGDGATATVPAGDQPFTTENNTDELTLPTVPGTPATTTTEPAAQSTTTVEEQTTTTVAEETTTTVENATTTTVTDDATTTSIAGGSADATVTKYQAGLEAASRTEVATVLAPADGGAATVEARKDAQEVIIPVVDLYATVSATGAQVDTTRPLLVRSLGLRPRVVRPTSDPVAMPVGSDLTTLTVSGTDVSGKPVSAPLEIRKSQPPLVTVTGNSDSFGGSFPWIWVAVAVIVLGAGAFVARRRFTATPSTDGD